MPKLLVLLKQKQIQELELTTDKVTIGRDEGNTIKLDDALISRNHVEIREEGGKYFLTDVGSANGTFVGTRRITANYELKSGDVIKISPYTIYFQLSAAETPTRIERPERPEDKTKIIGVTAPGAGEPGRDMTQMYTYSGAPKLLVRSGAEVGQSFDLSNNPLIGRGSECEITLSEATVSHRHARVQYIDNKLSIMDIGSKSGTRVNGKLIDKPTQLKDGDKIQLGEVTLEIEWKGAPRLSEEKATVPYFRPEPMEPAKSEWWKWAVGIAAGVIIIAAAIWLIYTKLPHGRSYTDLMTDANINYKNAFATYSIEKLNLASAQVDSALKRQSKLEAQDLKVEIAKNIDAVKDANDYTEQAKNAYDKGEFSKAANLAEQAMNRDPGKFVADAETIRIHSHKAVAKAFERAGKNTSALEQWKIINGLAPSDQDAIDAIHRLTGTPTPPLQQITDYERAFNAYRKGNLTDARAILDRASPSDKKEELLSWISLWEEANYNLERLNDTTTAIKKFGELITIDPNNNLVSKILIMITGTPQYAKWDYGKAKTWFDEVKDDWQKWADYGDKTALEKAQTNYKLIVNIGPPPSNVSSEELNLYNTAKERKDIKPTQ
jgi:pSer/pThr/pTyr-binding forkhead associated (FHA) protein/tetratricopeptide (TPR) repeat protein